MWLIWRDAPPAPRISTSISRGPMRIGSVATPACPEDGARAMATSVSAFAVTWTVHRAGT